jgi:hypothetical protein
MFARLGDGGGGRGALGLENARLGIVGKGVYPAFAGWRNNLRRFLGDSAMMISSLS